MSTSQRTWMAVCATVAILVLPVRTVEAITIAGELVVDLRGVDLEGSSNTWINQDTTGDTVGDFVTKDMENVNIATDIGDGTTTAPFSLYVPQNPNKAVLSSLETPASLEGNSTRTVEAWINAVTTPGGATVAGWGTSGNSMMSSFRYSGGGNGLFSGWFIDSGWDGATLPTNEWVHVAYTWDGTSATGYINGSQVATADLSGNENYPLATAHAFLGVGAGRNAGTDAFNGYIADVRVHTGVLSSADVMNNYSEGIATSADLPGDLDGDGDIDSVDLGILRTNLFTNGFSSQGDINRDGTIDWVDWRLLKDNPARQFGDISPGSIGSSPTQVPEPSSLIGSLLASAALGGILVRRRHRCRK